MFNNKKILFIGPLGNPVKKFIDRYDYVIRTNNFFGIDKKLLHSDRCDVLVTNGIYTRCYSHKILKNINKVQMVYSEDKRIFEELRKDENRKYKNKVRHLTFHKKEHDFVIRGQPLMLGRVLYHIIEHYKPKEFYVTGVDFYQSKDIKKFWMKGYAVKQSTKLNVLNRDSTRHNLRSNIQMLKYYVDKLKWVKCDSKVQAIINSL